MYAIIDDSGKQYRVSEGQVVTVDKRSVSPGSAIEFDRVLLVSDGEKVLLGNPVLAQARVKARVEGEFKGKKLRVVHFRRRKGYRKETGHRQKFMKVRIQEIVFPKT